MELQEIESRVICDDGTLPPDSAWARWDILMNEAAEKYGKTVVAAPKLAGYLKSAGFTNITTKVYKLPVGDWPKVC